jgi:hypothetical protein
MKMQILAGNLVKLPVAGWNFQKFIIKVAKFWLSEEKIRIKLQKAGEQSEISGAFMRNFS